MRKNFTCKFNGYVTPDNRESIIRSIVSQLQGYNCDPEVTLTDDAIIVSVTLEGDLTPSLIRDKLAFNYFITSVSTGDTIRKIKKMILPSTASSVGLERLQEIRDGKFDNLEVADPEGIYKNIESLVMSSRTSHFNGVSHPVPGTIPELLRHLQDHHAATWKALNSSDDEYYRSILRDVQLRGWQAVLEDNNGEYFGALSRAHLQACHDDFPQGVGGDHQHHHREELDTDHFSDIDDELGLHRILTTPVTTPTTTILSSWVKQADPTGDLIPEIFTGDNEGGKEIENSERAQITKDDTVDEPDDLGETPSLSKLFAGGGGIVTHSSKTALWGPNLGVNPPPHQRVDVTDSMPAARQGVGVSSDTSQAAIPFNSLVSGDHDDHVLAPGTTNTFDSLGTPVEPPRIPASAKPKLVLTTFRRISNEEDEITRTTQLPMSEGGGLPAVVNVEPWSNVASRQNLYFALAGDPYDDEDSEDNEGSEDDYDDY